MIVGSQDILTPVADSEEIAELVPGAELVVLTGAPHGLMLEAAAPFNAAVLDFLERADRQSSEPTMSSTASAR